MAYLPEFSRLLSCFIPRKKRPSSSEIELLSNFRLGEGRTPSAHAILLVRHRFDQALKFAALQARISLLPGELQNQILLHVIESHLSVGDIWLTPKDYLADKYNITHSLAQPKIYKALNYYWMEVAWNTFYESNTIHLNWQYWTVALMWPKPHWHPSRIVDLGLLRDPHSVSVLDVELRMGSHDNRAIVKRAPCYTPRNRQVKLCLETTDCYTRKELTLSKVFTDVGLLHEVYVLDFAYSEWIHQVCIYLIWPEQWDAEAQGDGTV